MHDIDQGMPGQLGIGLIQWQETTGADPQRYIERALPVSVLVGAPARKHLEHHNAQTVDVSPRPDTLRIEQLLLGHVGKWAP